MRLFVLATTALLLATGLAALVPAGSAVAWCSSALNKPLHDPDCQHLLCWGRSYNYQYSYESCTFSEDDIPDPCRPGCELP